MLSEFFNIIFIAATVVAVALSVLSFIKPIKNFLIKSLGADRINSWISIAHAVTLALIFRSSVSSPYKIPSSSMTPTLKVGDFIFANKLSYGVKVPFTNHNFINFSGPKRGDIVVFIEPRRREVDYIKRVVGVAGDKIELKNDKLYINDKLMERTPIRDIKPYMYDYKEPTIRDAADLFKENFDGKEHLIMEIFPLTENFGPETVPSGHLFMMGDNRDNSEDSRKWGFLPVTNVRGRAIFTWLSLDSVNPWIRISDNFVIPSIRFNRFGRSIH